MATIFEKTALDAAKLAGTGAKRPPKEAWEEAIKKHTKSENTRKKNCPKTAFLCLCKLGVVKGVPQVDCTDSDKGISYVKKALDALRKNPQLAKTPRKLWDFIGNENVHYDSQMHVVCALWNANLLTVEKK